jgi:hypothetical protein
MSDGRKSPTLRRRRLSAELRRLREHSGLTAIEVDRRFGWTGGKFAKMARGQWTRPNLRDIADLLDLFEVTDQHERDELLRWTREARERGWWHPYREMISESYTTYIGLEAEAASVLDWELGVMPGLLQTPEYARNLLRIGASELSADAIEQRVKIRLERQKLLTRRTDPLRLVAVLDEGVLHRIIGGRDVLRAQLEYILELASAGTLPRLTVQILPFDAREVTSAGAQGGFSILEFPEVMDPDAVYVENVAGELLIEDGRDVAAFKIAFQKLGGAALAPADSLDLIANRIAGLR